jgi:hypothetical protein
MRDTTQKYLTTPIFGRTTKKAEGSSLEGYKGECRELRRKAVCNNNTSNASSKSIRLTQEQNCATGEKSPRNMIHADEYPLRTFLADEPGPEPRYILHFIKHQNCPLWNPEFVNEIDHPLSQQEEIDGRVIHDDLIATLDEETSAYQTVVKYLCEA